VSNAVAEVTVLRPLDEVLRQASLQEAAQLVEESDVQVLHLDLGGIRLPTAEGLSALIALNKELRARGGALVLTNVSASTYEVFTLTRLIEVLDVRPE
jgi:anti-anti-sigma factor